ncbi:hypothetical protein CR513_34244, partial [Mucuna pruriens]
MEQSGTWELVSLPSSKKAVGCRWVFVIKVGPNSTVDRLKARLVAKGYTRVYGLDYRDTFSPVAKIITFHLLLATVAIHPWPLHQFEIKNVFLHSDLDEEIYMEQPPSFVAQEESSLVCNLRRSLYGLKQSPRAWFGKFSQVVQNFGMTRSEADHSVFYCHSSSGKCVYLVVYVDDIVIIGNDDIKIFQLKQCLFSHFQTKDLSHLKGIVISQRKYGLNILQETSMSNYRLVNSPMDPNLKLMVKHGEFYSNPERYRRLVGKPIYLSTTSPNISFAVPCIDHWAAILRILRYIKKTPGQGLLYEDKGDTHISGYCNADWAGSPIDRQSITEYRAMASITCELIWVKQLIQELKFVYVQPMKLYCDNQVTLHIASNPIFHVRTKHIEIDCYFVREKLLAKEISTKFVNSNNQLADIFTKCLRESLIQAICSKLGAYNLYALA